MIDSLLTMTKAGAAWLLGTIVVCVLVDRALTAITGHEEVIFGLMALVVAVAFVVRSVYTLGKMAWHRLRGTR